MPKAVHSEPGVRPQHDPAQSDVDFAWRIGSGPGAAAAGRRVKVTQSSDSADVLLRIEFFGEEMNTSGASCGRDDAPLVQPPAPAASAAGATAVSVSAGSAEEGAGR
mmetsp:Transcript_18703/g.54831  ORF Transcript_18703/g.54831 Transcript_18703/m.54831 type:complete len:107 (-) Transcript_18703:1411-1731(-)